MRIEVRVREAEISFTEEMAFLARRGGVGYAGEVQGIYTLGLPASLAAKGTGRAGLTRSQAATCPCREA